MINQNNFVLIDRGSNSEVFVFQQNVVLKMVDVKFLRQKAFLKNEHEIMKQMNHPNILKVLQWKSNIPIKGVSDPGSDCRRDILVMEYANKGSLLKVLKMGLSQSVKKGLVLDLIKGLKYLHQEQKVAHRDLKLDNVLVREDSNGKLIPMIADFGFAVKNNSAIVLSQEEVPTQKSSRSLRSSKKFEAQKSTEKSLSNLSKLIPFLCNSFKGTTKGYMPPEIHSLLQTPNFYDPFKCDIFSFGVILFAVFFNKLPFSKSTQKDSYYNLIIQKKFSTFWCAHKITQSSYSNINIEQLKHLLQSMFSFDPETRPSTTQIIKSPFFQNLEFQLSILSKEQKENNKNILISTFS